VDPDEIRAALPEYLQDRIRLQHRERHVRGMAWDGSFEHPTFTDSWGLRR